VKAGGFKALGFFSQDSTEPTIAFGKLSQSGFATRQRVRDLRRNQDLPDIVNPSEEPLTPPPPDVSETHFLFQRAVSSANRNLRFS
jgi:hypothetical protein